MINKLINKLRYLRNGLPTSFDANVRQKALLND